jgi:hypothetical protein
VSLPLTQACLRAAERGRDPPGNAEGVGPLRARVWLPTEIELDCECLDEACGEHLLLSADEYKFLRRFPDYFAVAPEHIRDSDHVIVCEPHRFGVVQ